MKHTTHDVKESLGTGLMKGTADIYKMRQKWRDARINGETTLQFKQWLKQQGGNVSSMPK